MKRQRPTMKYGRLSCLLLLGLITIGWSGKTVDHSLYGELLKKYMKDSVVDYRGLKTEDRGLKIEDWRLEIEDRLGRRPGPAPAAPRPRRPQGSVVLSRPAPRR